MSAKNDGGPAYPGVFTVPAGSWNPVTSRTAEQEQVYIQLGMSLRQAYKIAAIKGALANPNLSDTKAAQWIVNYAVEVADLALEEDAAFSARAQPKERT